MFHGELREFQLDAYDKILDWRRLIVAYDMGLGKTVVTIAALEELLEADEVESGLLVVPASLKYQWAKAIRKFTGDEANVLVIDGTPKQREAQYERAMEWSEYTILGYSQVVDDWKFVRDLPRDFVVLDEATYIKNFRAKRTRKVKRLRSDIRIALTGQPVENRAEEVFSIMEWVDADVLGRFDLFDRAFIVRNNWGGVQRYRNLKTLNKRLLSSSMVRKKRDDPDVRDQLPAVSEVTESVVLDAKSKRLYRIIANDLLDELEKVPTGSGFDLAKHYGGGDDDYASLQARARIMSRLMCLRMLCDHPNLLRLSAERYEFGQQHPNEGMKAGSAYAHDLLERGELDRLPDRSKKLDELARIIDEIQEADPGAKIVAFSYFKPMLKWAQHALKKYEPVLFTGDLNAKQKQASKDTFEEDPACKVFLSSDAGGYGVDLPVASYLINLDLPWSAGAIDQRNARIIRLSTEHDAVFLKNLLVQGSIEERQYDMLEQKRAIASAIVDGKTNRAGTIQLKLTTLKQFLIDSNV